MKRIWLKIIMIAVIGLVAAVVALAIIEVPVSQQIIEQDVTGAIQN
jgi:hypothetical protein